MCVLEFLAPREVGRGGRSIKLIMIVETAFETPDICSTVVIQFVMYICPFGLLNWQYSQHTAEESFPVWS